MTRLVNEADIVNKTRPLFTLSLEMTRLVNETRLLLVPGVNSDIYGNYTVRNDPCKYKLLKSMNQKTEHVPDHVSYKYQLMMSY